MIAKSIHLLAQCAELIENITDQAYVHVPKGLASSGIGGHVRHCLDFYRSFLNGLGTGRIDYDARMRDQRIEADRTAALGQIETIIARLKGAADVKESISLHVKKEVAPDWVESSIGREIQFLTSHTVHHFAMIAIMLRLQGIEPGGDFGVAPSTIDYWKQNAAENHVHA